MLYLHSAGLFHPENVIDNRFLEELDIGTTSDWIVERVGIESRRTVLSLDYIKTTRNANPAMAAEASQYTNAQTGASAGREALRNAGIGPGDIGLVIAGSCTPQFSCPAEACTIAAAMDIDAPAMDINSACSSLAAQLHFLNGMREESLPDYVLIVNPDNSTPDIDYSDRNTCSLWGDASSAVVVSSRVRAPLSITKSMFTSKPSGHDKVQFLRHGHFRQEGRTVQTFAIKRSVAMLRELRAGLDPAQAERVKFIGHQANLRMLEAVCKWGQISAADHFFNVDEYGNCGAAGAPTVLAQNWDRVRAGDRVVLSVVGSGLSWGGVLIEANDDTGAAH